MTNPALDAVQECISQRRSVEAVRDTPIDRGRLHALIAAALWAPNHKLSLPFAFVVASGDARDALADAHAQARRRVAPGMSDEAMRAQRALTRRAPHIIVCIHRATDDDPVRRREDRDTVAAGVQNLLLAAHADGLGAIWRTGAFVDEPEVRAHVGCRDEDEIVGFVYVGEPESVPPAPPRPAVDDVTQWRDA